MLSQFDFLQFFLGKDGCAAHADELSADPLQCACRLHNLQLMNQELVHKQEDKTVLKLLNVPG